MNVSFGANPLLTALKQVKGQGNSGGQTQPNQPEYPTGQPSPG